MLPLRFFAIRSRWCFRHSMQMQPRTYTGVVLCSRVVPAARHQSVLQRRAPSLVDLCQAPDLVRCQSKTERFVGTTKPKIIGCIEPFLRDAKRALRCARLKPMPMGGRPRAAAMRRRAVGVFG